MTLQRAWQATIRQAQQPAVEERLQSATGFTLTRPARMALTILSEKGPLNVSELALLAGGDVSTMSRTLRHLTDAGLVAREPGEDLRAVRISITADGHDALARLSAAGREILSEVLCGWSEADKDVLSRLLMRFADDFAAALPRGGT